MQHKRCRPNDYNPAAAAALGPSGPNPNLNLSAIGLGASKSGASACVASYSICQDVLDTPKSKQPLFACGMCHFLYMAMVMFAA
eukprot:1152021-Pelagomonas_calceolata.AAC.3